MFVINYIEFLKSEKTEFLLYASLRCKNKRCVGEAKLKIK